MRKCLKFNRLFVYFFSFVLFSLGLCLSKTSDVSAYSFGSSSRLTWGVSSSSSTPDDFASYAQMYFNPQDGTRTYWATPLGNAAGIRMDFNNLPSAGLVNNIRLYSYTSIPKNSFVSFYLRYWGANPAGNADVNFNGFEMSNAHAFDISCSNNIDHINGNDSVNIDRTCLMTYYYTGDTTEALYLSGKLNFSAYGGGVQILPGTFVQVVDDVSGAGGGLTEAQLNGDFKIWLQAQLSNLYAQGADQLNALNQIKVALNAQDLNQTQTNNLIQDLIDQQDEERQAIQQGNQEAQDRWEADKAEEAEREEQGHDNADALGSTFRFEIRNPFMGLLGLFTNNCPVSIPTVAGMLGSSQTTYPCWFSSQTRGILTPVIGISASVLLFGFIVRGFLRKGNFSGGIEI